MRVVMVAALAALASAHVIVTPAHGPLAVAPLSASAQCVRPVLRTFDEARCGQPNMNFAPVKAINNMKTVKALKKMKAYKVGGASRLSPAPTRRHPPPFSPNPNAIACGVDRLPFSPSHSQAIKSMKAFKAAKLSLVANAAAMGTPTNLFLITAAAVLTQNIRSKTVTYVVASLLLRS